MWVVGLDLIGITLITGYLGQDDSANYWVKVYQVTKDFLYEDYVLEISNGIY